MKNIYTQEQHNIVERNGQLYFAANTEYWIPENAPVRLADAQLEELDYRKLYDAYSPAGRNSDFTAADKSKMPADAKEKVFSLTGLKTLSGLKRRLSKTKPEAFASRRKTQEQREWEQLDLLRQSWEKHAEALETMGPDRNSYSKTDKDATFMRMKDDHLGRGQLKPAYNAQLAVNSEYVTGVEVFSNRTDYGTLEPFLEELKQKHGKKYKKVTTDAGFECLDNYLYLEENDQMSFIKPLDYEQRKTKKFRSQIGRMENMTYDEEADTYTCAMGKTLSLHHESKDWHSKRDVVISHYRCEDCSGCLRREECCKSKDVDKPKEICVRKQFKEKRATSEANITSEE